MLYTLTTNPAVDVNVTTEQITASSVNRTRDMVCSPNGKGLNVSFTLKHFGTQSGIMGFFGGFTGEYITAYCKDNGYCMVPVPIEETTRINYFVNTQQGEYKFVSEGPRISAGQQDQLLDAICNRQDMDMLSIHGSSANGQADDFYDRIFAICDAKQIPVVLDISSAKLKSLLQYRPLLIKPNDEELRDIFGLQTENETDVIAALQVLHAMGAQNILLTLGDRGAYFYDGASIWFCGTKKVTLKSSACAGDAFLAGFLSIWLQDKEAVERALKRAAAAGANTAESDGLGDFARVAEYEKSIHIRKIKQGGQAQWH